MLTTRTVVGTFLVGVAVLGADVVSSQDYPNKPIRIFTAPAGGGTDFTARLLAQGISASLGQPIVIDNRPLFPAVDAVSKAPPDGYTLLVQGASLWVAPLMQAAPYDVVRDFSPISLIERQVSVLVVHPSLPVRSVKELIALAKTKPGELNYSTGVAGGASHIGLELFKSMAGVNIVLIPYKGLPASITALISGEVQLTISDAGVVGPLAKAGKLRALAVTSAEPSALAPGLPAVAASGLPGYEAVGTTGMFAPAKTPAVIISRLNQEVVRSLNRPGVKEQFFNGGVETVGSSPEEAAAYIKSDVARKAKLIKDAGIKVN